MELVPGRVGDFGFEDGVVDTVLGEIAVGETGESCCASVDWVVEDLDTLIGIPLVVLELGETALQSSLLHWRCALRDGA